MTSKRAASSTPTLTHATPRAIPGSASSENLHQHTHTRDRQRRASGTPTSLPRRDSESLSARPTRARVGPLPKNGPENPLFPPLPPKVVKPRTSSQMKLERMEGVQKIEEDADEDKGDQTVKEEAGEKDPEDWEEYSAKQRKQRGFAGTGGAAAETEVKDEQQTREEDHETMTSGLSENEAGNESGEEGHVDDAKSTVTVTLEPAQNAETSEAKPQQDDAESQSSSEKRSLRTRGAAEPSTSTKGTAAHPQDGAIDVDREIEPSHEDAEDTGKEDEEFSPDGLAGRETAGQVDANGDVTRCICGREADIDAMMIQCDHCNVWQHGACVGIWGDEEAPDEYFCELCKPNLHAPLRRFLRQRQKQGLSFAVPTPSDLKQYYFASDRHKPSQSKRWTDPSVIKNESMSPPPPAATATQSKPSSTNHGASSKSHKAKAHSPAVDTRRSVGAGHRAYSGISDKSHNDSRVPGGTSARPGGTSTRRFSNTSSSDSPTSANGKGKDMPLGPVKKRSTMNSRDAAYEEAIAASLREAANGGPGIAGEPGATGVRSRRGVTESQEYAGEEEEAAKKGKKSNTSNASAGGQGAARGVKRSRQEEEEVDEGGDDVYVAGGGRKGKKKKDDEGKFGLVWFGLTSSTNLLARLANKAKHPNQYTYRPKTGMSGSSNATPTQAALAPEKARAMPHSPSKKQAASAASGSNAASRRLGGSGTRGGTPSSVSGSTIGQGSGGGNGGSLSWNLPDHLAPFAYTLPPTPPSMLEIITPRPAQSGKYKSSSDSAPVMNDPANGETPTHFEAPTKIRYPTKRMTIGEMRKRVRNLLEFVGRVQGEEDKRGERANLLELGVPGSASVGPSEASVKDTSVEQKGDGAVNGPADSMDVDKEPEVIAEDKADQDVDAKKEEVAVAKQPTPMDVDEAAASEPVGDFSQDGAKLSTDVTNGESGQSTNELPTVGVTDEKSKPVADVEAAPPAAAESSAEPSSVPTEQTTVPPPTAPSGPSQPAQSKSSQLLAELTSDLIRFQMMFEVGGSVFAAPQGMNGAEEE
ncbi:Histone deacetylase complex subunit [Naganishia albida]|nr:Histone deacetylase complex subunit [Naganishia albida]